MVLKGHWRPYFYAVLGSLLTVLVVSFLVPAPGIGLLLALLLVLVVGLLAGVLAGHAGAATRYRVEAGQRERCAQVLSAFAREMSAAVDTRQVVEQAQRVLEPALEGEVVVLLPDAQGRLQPPAPVAGLEPALAQWALRYDMSVGRATETEADSPFHYIPLRAAGGSCGVLALRPRNAQVLHDPDTLQELDTCARLVALAIERIHFVGQAQDLRLRATTENLRSSMLAALSHDLRTPLAGLIGLLDALGLEPVPLSARREKIVASIREMAEQMSRMVNNLLDMARIRSGDIHLQRDWHCLEEVVGSAIRSLGQLLGENRMRVVIPDDLPLVEVDALLLERVVANLVENAAKYSPPEAEILITAACEGPAVLIAVADTGKGLPEHFDPFGRFVRGDADSARSGLGLGLAICRAFVDAHGGSIRAANREGGGAVFTVSLPAGSPPEADAGFYGNGSKSGEG